mgnify:CR=1 FL=1
MIKAVNVALSLVALDLLFTLTTAATGLIIAQGVVPPISWFDPSDLTIGGIMALIVYAVLKEWWVPGATQKRRETELQARYIERVAELQATIGKMEGELVEWRTFARELTKDMRESRGITHESIALAHKTVDAAVTFQQPGPPKAGL